LKLASARARAAVERSSLALVVNVISFRSGLKWRKRRFSEKWNLALLSA
jgi:hypothetical protein